jgi:hypothetical protein
MPRGPLLVGLWAKIGPVVDLFFIFNFCILLNARLFSRF